jgi:hypothetical protein
LAALTFTENPVIEGGLNRSNQVEAGDVDKDGDLDAIALSGNSFAVLKNDGQATFGEPAFFDNSFVEDASGDTRSMVTADFDGDGDLDVVLGSLGAEDDDRVVSFHTNDGLGSFSFESKLATHADADFVDALAAGDLDGDNDTDLIVVARGANGVNGQILYLLNTDGQGTFSAPQVLTTEFAEPRAAHVADVDGDGDMDIIGSSSFDYDHNVFWFMNDGKATFTKHPTVLNTGVEPRFMSTGDFDKERCTTTRMAKGCSGIRSTWILIWREWSARTRSILMVMVTSTLWPPSTRRAWLSGTRTPLVRSAPGR